ncbi:Glucose-1-phosphate thymidylyltransferase [subsurface metagenome]
MKGVILAGGLGTRLLPLTKITNKHLLPVYDKPMIYYPLNTLIKGGIDDIMIVTGGNNAGDFLRLLGNGSDFGLKHINYTYQEGHGGIAAALSLAKHFVDGEKIVVILGDNIFEDNIESAVKEFEKQGEGAKIFLKKIKDPTRYGVPEIKGNKIIKIEEKPKNPKSSYAVTGLYMYDEKVFDIIKTLKLSARGELEITDVNNAYVKEGTMKYSILNGLWTDAGSSFESYYRANKWVAEGLISIF